MAKRATSATLSAMRVFLAEAAPVKGTVQLPQAGWKPSENGRKASTKQSPGELQTGKKQRGKRPERR
ncbi:hypothetical protein [Paraburkholderia haematera]|uniref:hypothetical protein n=1 Tax=Paraburkholderia haematera TaxID=2793077 RepID=UPI001B8B360B|nr:hypothetical protein [Paraburkholderia haematera]